MPQGPIGVVSRGRQRARSHSSSHIRFFAVGVTDARGNRLAHRVCKFATSQPGGGGRPHKQEARVARLAAGALRAAAAFSLARGRRRDLARVVLSDQGVRVLRLRRDPARSRPPPARALAARGVAPPLPEKAACAKRPAAARHEEQSGAGPAETPG